MSFTPQHTNNEKCPKCGELGMSAFEKESHADGRQCANCKFIEERTYSKEQLEEFRKNYVPSNSNS